MIKTALHQLNLLWLAIGFFSRLPVPKSVTYSPSLLNQANRYFSLVGLILAAILILLYSLLAPFLSSEIVVSLVMIASLLLTGAFHEDGLADMSDGMGGGMTIAKKLQIMKDSRIGTYGAVSLIMALLLKFQLLVALAQQHLLIASLLAAYALSRAIAGSLIINMTYVSEPESSKSKPLAQKQNTADLAILLAVGLLPLLLLPLTSSISILLVLALFRFLFQHWLNKRLGGYTGDCLGGAQQISELLIYLVIIVTSANSAGNV